jgi:cytochrome c
MRVSAHRLVLGSVLALALTACGRPAQQDSASAAVIPATISLSGDAAQGRLYFEGVGACAACHTAGTVKLIGPGMAGVMTTAGPVHTDSVTYNGNLPNGSPRTEENIAAWIRSGGQGEVGVMPGREVSDAEMANLLAYLRTITP